MRIDFTNLTGTQSNNAVLSILPAGYLIKHFVVVKEYARLSKLLII